MTKKTAVAHTRLVPVALAALVAAGTVASATPALADTRSESTSSYDRAMALFNKEDFRAARIELLKALKANPNSPVARLLSARVALELGAGVAAQTELEKAIQAGAPRDKTYHLMAHALMLQGKGDEALKTADSAKVPPQFAAYAARVRGRAQMVAGQFDRARGEFELASRLAPDDLSILLDRTRYEMLSGRRDEAEKLIDHALELRPTSSRSLVMKGSIVRARAGLAASIPFFNQAVQADPNNIEALLERAGTYGDLRREAEARADLKRVDQIQPNQPLGLYLQAVLEARAGRYAQANALMGKTRGVLDGYPPALMLQGMVAYQLGNLKVAEDYLTRVMSKSPDYVLARRLLASTQLRSNDPNASLETLKPLLDQPNADGQTLAMAAQAYARKGDYKTSQDFYARASKALPGSQELRTQLAMTQAATGNNQGALATLNGVIKSGADQPRALATMTLVKLRQGAFQDALASSNKLIQLKPALPLGYNMRGAAYLGLRNTKAAEADFRMALQKDPKFNEARRNLAQMMLSMNRTADAKAELQKVVANDPRDARAMMLLSAIAQRNANNADRIQWLTQAVNVDPKSVGPRMALVQAYVQTGQAGRATTTANALERDFPNAPAVVELVGMTALSNKNAAQAESAFNRLVALQPKVMGARLLLARTQAQQGHMADARSTYENALTLKGENLQPIYVDAVRLEQAANNPTGAAKMLARFRAAYPKSNIPDLLIGDELFRQNKVPQAIAAYNAARAKQFDRTAATRLSALYQAIGQPQNGVAVLNAYGKANPGDAVVQAAIAELQIGIGQYRPAIAVYEAMLPKGGNRAPAVLNNLAWAYHQVGDKRAYPTAMAALKLAPESAEVLDTAGVIIVNSKPDKERAQSYLEKAVRLSPRDPNIRYHLAIARTNNNRPKEALQELAIALKAPRFDSRAQALALQKKLLAR